ncbi:MAG: tRNA pseudouridine synthase A [Solirubrobacterales bacterium]|nr:tRNA pseudouridine synthase A [Solirubrobacterales bacterium]
MPTARIDLAYLGTDFSGWATQAGRRTVQEELEAALERVLDAPAELTVAGRTDAGVHAWGQVASVELREPAPGDLVAALNGTTGHDLVVLEAGPAADGFDARRDALSRTYCYRLATSRLPNAFERGLSLWWRHRIDRGALDACAEAIMGRHDFTAFTPTRTDHVHFEREVIRCEWRPAAWALPKLDPRLGGEAPDVWPGEMLELWIEADAFMRGMVRVLVGTMLEVAGGRRSIESLERLLDGAPREDAGDTARAQGLHLSSVRYQTAG